MSFQAVILEAVSFLAKLLKLKKLKKLLKLKKLKKLLKLMKLKKLKTAYSYFKPYMIEQIVKIRKNISLRGRPVEMSYDNFLDALFFVVDECLRYRTSNLHSI